MKFHIETMGCQMNKADSERVAGLLAAAGWAEAVDARGADLVLVNGCVVRAKAEDKAVARVRELLRAPHRPKVALIGCAAEWRGENLRKELPALHMMVSPSRLDEIPSWIDGGGIALGDRPWIRGSTEVRRAAGIKAWIPVMRGCGHRCTFCVVPRTRGPEVSFPPSYVSELASEALRAGCVELDLLGQRVSAYKYRGVTFGALVRGLCRLPGVKRIRFTAPYPADVGHELLTVMASEPAVEHRLHLPLQSGSDRILARMGRGYTVSQFNAIVEQARALMPDLGLSTDVIVGFPGETEDDYLATESLVRTLEFDTAFTFMFSPRALTPSATMDEQVPLEIKRERLARLIAAHHGALHSKVAGSIGHRMEVLVDGPDRLDAGCSAGKTRNGRVVVVQGHHVPGSMVSVTITGLRGHTLCGVPDKEA
ncbi:MAG: MiaB/RimO family radical SAM methylthiotransferase [Candidatus Eisenbacteria bacterium]|jgi:tRNA-2-methylthio-N6-dimethylallyladenosine synthase|nr:MiaB/RimO family radical SAM methylthiotransferase [Candidatus Eisenbacteria bacterium]